MVGSKNNANRKRREGGEVFRIWIDFVRQKSKNNNIEQPTRNN
jgi:hypothetical protein